MEPTKNDALTPDLTAQVMEGLSKRPVIAVDYDRYAHFLEHSDGTEEQKLEFLQAVWSIIVNIVDLGFGVHPLQQACGQVESIGRNAPSSGPDALYLKDHSITEKFEQSTDAERQPEAEGVVL